MDPKWQAIFFALAILCWLFGAFQPTRNSPRFTSLQLACLGWAFFAFPFAWDAASTGW